MCKSGRNECLVPLFGGEFEGGKLPEPGGGDSQIHDNIENTAAKAAHKFCLRMGRSLKMQPPYGPRPLGKGMIVLNESYADTCLPEGSFIIALGKPAARINVPDREHMKDFRQDRIGDHT